MRIEPAASVQGGVALPGDKSISHRAVLIGAVAEGESVVTGLGRSGDTESTIAAVRTLGVRVDEDGDTLRIAGAGLRNLQAPEGPIDCGNAGTLARLLPGILAGVMLAFARALGEFGSLVLISGNIPFKTEVSSVFIRSQIESGNVSGAAAVSVVLLTISLLLLVAVSLVVRFSMGRRGETA